MEQEGLWRRIIEVKHRVDGHGLFSRVPRGGSVEENQ